MNNAVTDFRGLQENYGRYSKLLDTMLFSSLLRIEWYLQSLDLSFPYRLFRPLKFREIQPPLSRQPSALLKS